jgi:hypothetical protein
MGGQTLSQVAKELSCGLKWMARRLWLLPDSVSVLYALDQWTKRRHTPSSEAGQIKQSFGFVSTRNHLDSFPPAVSL